ncbi:MAG: TAXI family TRAP transporter solute-binding subunit [Hyphomicrobiaceae bacterium]
MQAMKLGTAICAISAFAFSSTAQAQDVKVLGGGLKGGAYAMAVGLSKLLKDKAGMNAQPQTSGGMVAQARLLEKGSAQFAFGIGGPIGAWAYKGEGRFKSEGAKAKLRAIMAYPFGNLQWVTLADSPVKSLADLKGKTISVGKASSTTQTFGKIFIEAHGIKMSELKATTPGFGGGFNQLRNGNVAAHLTLGKTPISALREMATTKNFRLVHMDPAVIKKIADGIGSGVTIDNIAPDAYGNAQKNTKAATTLGLFFGFSTSTNTSADLVYKVTKALFENLDDYKKATKKAKAVTLEAACKGLAFPLHEGAKRYYKEIGHKGCS